ncbi:MAG: hypothetical protein HY254_11935 [Burkholderiales bacterium]|nr:hypothetical protein [Burkholderiales bacterium]
MLKVLTCSIIERSVNMVRLALILLLMLFSNASFAACEEAFVDEVRRGLGYIEERHEISQFVVCKPMPDAPGISIVAIARLQKGSEVGNSDVMGEYNLDISLVNTSSGDTIAHQFYPRRFVWDGTRFGGIEIDTANYKITSSGRAFGIRSSEGGTGFSYHQSLSLYILRGKSLLEILSNAPIIESFNKRFPQCMNETRTGTRTINMAKKKKNGHFDLLVSEELVDTRDERIKGATLDEDDCQVKVIKREIKKYLLRFDGKRYVIPREMVDFECRIC